ncbi:unnamed protein product [Prorocentrum cordatum]|uniref:Aminotransferase class I/classII large domain-containing protein n=1 Tax=Prorocentrum cordatum TaxID=2364126 RepID=A0ABN9VZR6_9DINO|nr:unnamed protein product [Polarella glacialis]
MNPRLKDMEYAVRGEVPIRAEEIAAEMEACAASGQDHPFNFSSLLRCNIGNPQSVGQPPITYYRQVLSLVDSPSLLQKSSSWMFRRGTQIPSDVIERARSFSSSGSTGAYSHSQGLASVRRDVCDFIEARDGGPECDISNIFLLNGASAGITSVFTALLANPKDAVMVPVPQYPIYSALITLLGGKMIPYYLDEENDWGLSVEELQRAIGEARKKGQRPRALVMINPGNPTGQVLSEETLRMVARFCAKEKLLFLADEVYQENVYLPGSRFVSARKIAHELEQTSAGAERVELVSFHSTSKGLIGECGRRGGYMEFWNIDPQVHAQLYKLQSSQLCPNLDGQVMTGLMVRPPKPGEPSYRLFEEESSRIFGSLQRKAAALTARLNEVDGVTCNAAAGAMYAFPIELPRKAIEDAEAKGLAPDLMYCLSLLEATGIVTVPGTGFGQRPGQWHFRITFLPEEKDQARPRPRRLPRPPRGIRGEVRGLRPRGSYEARPRDRALHATASLGQAHQSEAGICTPDFVIKGRGSGPSKTSHFRPPPRRGTGVPDGGNTRYICGSSSAEDSEKAFQGCAASSGLPFRPASARRRLPRRGLVSLVQPLSQRRVPVRYTSRVLRAAFQFCIAGRSVLRGIKSIRLYEPSALSNLDLNFLRKQLS